MLGTFTFVPSVRAGDTFQMADASFLSQSLPIVIWFKLPCLTGDIKPKGNIVSSFLTKKMNHFCVMFGLCATETL